MAAAAPGGIALDGGVPPADSSLLDPGFVFAMGAMTIAVVSIGVGIALALRPQRAQRSPPAKE